MAKSKTHIIHTHLFIDHSQNGNPVKAIFNGYKLKLEDILRAELNDEVPHLISTKCYLSEWDNSHTFKQVESKKKSSYTCGTALQIMQQNLARKTKITIELE